MKKIDNRFAVRIWDSQKKKMEHSTHWECILKFPLRAVEDYETVMQCTGFKDKNGELLFESDIVKFNIEDPLNYINAKKAIVKWDRVGAFVFSSFFRVGEYIDCYGNEFEIIGNIYENPELMK